MKHDLDSSGLPGKSIRRPPIEFPISLVEPVREDRLGAIRCVVWGLLFEVAVCIVVALAWRLRFIFR